MKAYCYRSGLIRIGKRLPKGAIQILEGSDEHVRAVIQATARLAYDGITWLVPGIPEAPSEREARRALDLYLDWIKIRAANSHAQED
jgi:hypothetical protein